ncbi:MAG: EAL domain-containing protein [Candidatus Thiodiazotropha sp. (ex Myrtea spinifera)]|nr:EAL domain-containing protein [Candidatus Thiodiazotropha sp. (ex Myrtea spinifera)]MCU7830655.1 EAL domain-containing protein [Candidatus Thiodiazotropha sp. (ex Myrtea sp. 'scaly one' KF741663)]
MTRPTIFRHLFIRVAVILLGINLLFSLVLMPIYKDKLIRMIAIQGETFANSTIAACGEALYTEDYSFIISYVSKVLQKTPEIIFVTFTSNSGQVIDLTGDNWSVKLSDISQDVLQADSSAYTIAHKKDINVNGTEQAFIFSKPLTISGLDWGTFTLGISDEEYESLLVSYFRNVALFSVLLVIITLLLLHGSSRNLGHQLSVLRKTASELAGGNLSARAPSDAIGEISLLATTLNGMAESLDENTRSLRRLASLVEDTNDSIIIFNNKNEIIYVNSALTRLLRLDENHFPGMELFSFLSYLKIGRTKQRNIISEISDKDFHDWSTDITYSISSNQAFHLTMRIEKFDIHEVETGGFFIILTDITRRKQLEHELETLAYVDKLTRLPNRRYFIDRMNEAVEEAEAFDSKLTLFFMDIDNFKIINDSLGHEVGDMVLTEAGWRIQEALRSDDTVCRLGGDEFTAIIRGVNDFDTISRVSESILKNFELPFYVQDHELRTSASIGIVTYPNDGLTTKELIKNADTAMYAAKKGGKSGFRFFSEDMHQDMREYLDIESSLRKSINSTGLHLVYQPFVNTKNNKIDHCEALLRWDHPERGMIPPGKFIPIAEQSGLIKIVGEWVFDQVCKQIKQWNFDINVSINVSGTELADRNYIDRLHSKLIEYDIEPYRIQLEFTEHVLVSEEGKNLPLLNQLKRLGFQLAVDDFGTGFSSLSYISELPIDIIKIDKSFINRLPDDRKTVAVVKSIISLAHSLDIKTIGEGAENINQVEWLNEHDCKLIQGYYFHRPMDSNKFESLINKRKISSISNNIKPANNTNT